MTLEDEFENIGDTLACYYEPKTPQASDKMVVAVRALCHAVLEEILPACSSGACGSRQPDGSVWRCWHCTLMARIDALGQPAKEEPHAID
jgi:hypothetical protein